jgi:hypothetical protein
MVPHTGRTLPGFITLNRLATIDRIIHNSITSIQEIGLHTLRAGISFIRPTGIDTVQAVSTHRLSFTESIAPSGISSIQATGTHTLKPGVVYINPSGVVSQQNTEIHRLSNSIFISSSSITSNENIGLHRLVPNTAAIYSSGIQSIESSGTHRLKPGNLNINPDAISGGEVATIIGGGTYLSFQEFIYTNSNWPGQPYYGPIIPSAQDTPNTHRLFVSSAQIYPSSVTSKEIIGSHTLKLQAYRINLNGIPSGQIISRHKLNLLGKPGSIHSWFEKIHRIENELIRLDTISDNYRRTIS